MAYLVIFLVTLVLRRCTLAFRSSQSGSTLPMPIAGSVVKFAPLVARNPGNTSKVAATLDTGITAAALAGAAVPSVAGIGAAGGAGIFAGAIAAREIKFLSTNGNMIPGCRVVQGSVTIVLGLVGVGFAAAALLTGAAVIPVAGAVVMWLSIGGCTAGALTVAHDLAVDSFGLPLYCNSFEKALVECRLGKKSEEDCKALLLEEMQDADRRVQQTATRKAAEKGKAALRARVSAGTRGIRKLWQRWRQRKKKQSEKTSDEGCSEATLSIDHGLDNGT
eukprot:TRINITY_DN58344_c0_g1_i1.p1 TRINITY_DN58344_c0_g1~~TRINITY_DN58344_c0_g1_i1.p1  ORF type:complete len:286 (-),score=25.86 TRINITY_DN58344_c0_g1_i1:54-884(-)